MKDIIFKIKVYFKEYCTFYIGFSDWKEQIWDEDLDESSCCDGDMCCCGGRTLRQNLIENLKS